MPWRWPGPRGEGYVAIQAALLAWILLGPRHLAASAHWAASLQAPIQAAALLCLLWSAYFGFYGLHSLGRNLTVYPRPKEGAALVQSGAYRFVRHPIYSGVLALSLAWAFWVQGELSLLACGLLFWLFNRKAKQEEIWLAERFPDYMGYQRRTKRLIPWLY